ncbi:hypothetical protein FOZ63_007502, partial [Perkinsus olseni]
DAAATSQVLVASATLARVLSSIYVQLHGSSSAQSVIILPYAALMLPPMMVGGLLGVYLYTWLPEIVQMVLYVLTAVLASCMGFKKGMRLWKSERAEASSIAEAATRPEGTFDSTQPSVKVVVVLIALLGAVWALVSLSRLLLGSSSTPSLIGVPYCQYLYWTLSGVVIVVLILMPGLVVLVAKSPDMIKLAVKLSGALLCETLLESSAT